MKNLSIEYFFYMIGSGFVALGFVFPFIDTGLIAPYPDMLNGFNFLRYATKYGHADVVFAGIVVLLYSACGLLSCVFAGLQKLKLATIFGTICWILFFIFILTLANVSMKINIPSAENPDVNVPMSISLGGLAFLVMLGVIGSILGTIITFVKTVKNHPQLMDDTAFIIGVVGIGGVFLSFLPCLHVINWVLLPLSVLGFVIAFIPAKKYKDFQNKASAALILCLCTFVLGIVCLVSHSC